jgi:hypothetical protein
VNRFEVVRLRVVFPDAYNWGVPDDVAVAVIDGVWLSHVLDDSFPGVDVSFVAPPSRHWLGEPTYVEHDGAVVLDGGCGEAGCCGVVARIRAGRDTMRWSDFYAHGLRPPLPPDLAFTFDRAEYEAVLRDVELLEPQPWPIER